MLRKARPKAAHLRGQRSHTGCGLCWDYKALSDHGMKSTSRGFNSYAPTGRMSRSVTSPVSEQSTFIHVSPQKSTNTYQTSS